MIHYVLCHNDTVCLVSLNLVIIYPNVLFIITIATNCKEDIESLR